MEGLAIASEGLILVLSLLDSLLFMLEPFLLGLVYESVNHKWEDVEFGKGKKQREGRS